MTTERVPCKKCEAMVLPDTAERCAGMCMPCYQYSPEREKILKKEFKKRFQEWTAKADYRSILTEGSSEFGLLNPKLLATFEEKYCVKLPADLRQLMMHQNGGWFHELALKEESLFNGVAGITLDPFEDQKLATVIPVYEWLTIRGDVEGGSELVSYKSILDRLMILETDGHAFTCLDYRKGNECSGIVWIDVESGFNGDVEKLSDDFKSLFTCWDKTSP
ncbi:MAG: SMI1/KNR4 family protein [Verrucomicrobiota bacterium]